MRIKQKEQILEFVETLYEVNAEICNAVKKEEHIYAKELLSVCQESIIELGGNLEKLEGEGCPVIRNLEFFCELLYDIYNRIENIKSVCDLNRMLRENIFQIETSIKNNITAKKEIVFFPYKVSMWDSLEGVYLAAKKRPEYDAYCVPIPYFERNADGSIGEMHYEGNEYPPNVEVFDWKQYNFEERIPEAIFIHNPYDEYNHVTCVHPRFFCSNLVNYTKNLVYIPYFILGDIKPDDTQAVDSIKHFCHVPGVIYANNVIVQSEDMRRIYINEYKKDLKENHINIDNNLVERKFWGIGSPKLDKIYSINVNEINIPNEWKNKIARENESNKKIVLYNLGIGNLLNTNEKMILKIKNVLEVFYKFRDKITLLWRPHPLLIQTLRSMRPFLLEEYEEVVRKYKEDNWGIYDDTNDMDRAILISDAYYGDESSLVALFEQTGRRIKLQNPHAIDNWEEEFYRTIWFSDFLLLNDSMYFVPAAFSGLLSADLLDGKCSLERELDVLPAARYGAYFGLGYIDGKVVMAPFRHNSIEIYDLAHKSLHSIDLGKKLYSNLDYKFFQVITYQDRIYLIPGRYPDIIEIDLSKIVRRYELDLERLGHKLEERMYLFSRNHYIFNGDLFLAAARVNVIVKFNLENGEREYLEIEQAGQGFRTLSGCEEFLYIQAFDNKIYRYNIITKDVEMVYMKNTEDSHKKYMDSLGNSTICNNKFIFWDEYKGKMAFVDLNTFNSSFIDLPITKYDDYSLWQKGKGNAIGFIKSINNCIYVFSTRDNTLYIMDLEGTIKNKLHFSYDGVIPYNIKRNEEIEEISENYISSLTNYLNRIFEQHNYGDVEGEFDVSGEKYLVVI